MQQPKWKPKETVASQWRNWHLNGSHWVILLEIRESFSLLRLDHIKHNKFIVGQLVYSTCGLLLQVFALLFVVFTSPIGTHRQKYLVYSVTFYTLPNQHKKSVPFSHISMFYSRPSSPEIKSLWLLLYQCSGTKNYNKVVSNFLVSNFVPHSWTTIATTMSSLFYSS